MPSAENPWKRIMVNFTVMISDVKRLRISAGTYAKNLLLRSIREKPLNQQDDHKPTEPSCSIIFLKFQTRDTFPGKSSPGNPSDNHTPMKKNLVKFTQKSPSLDHRIMYSNVDKKAVIIDM